MRPFFAAMRFLTVLPMPESWSGGEKDLAQSVPYFPVVGVLIGVLVAALDYAFGRVFPLVVTSILTAIALTAVSGGLHLDGLADTADGFLSSRPRERMLEIMRDSRTGPMGVVAVVFVVVLKIAALASIDGPIRPGVVFLMPIAGRSALVTMMAVLLYARKEGGLCSIFRVRRHHALWAFVLLAAAGVLAAGWIGLFAGVMSFAMALVLCGYAYRKIGGQTGDTLGATCELIELVPALVASAWIHIALRA